MDVPLIFDAKSREVAITICVLLMIQKADSVAGKALFDEWHTFDTSKLRRLPGYRFSSWGEAEFVGLLQSFLEAGYINVDVDPVRFRAEFRTFTMRATPLAGEFIRNATETEKAIVKFLAPLAS